MGGGGLVLSFHLLPLSADCSERGRAAIYHLWIMARDNVTGEGTQLFSKTLVLCTRRVGWMSLLLGAIVLIGMKYEL